MQINIEVFYKLILLICPKYSKQEVSISVQYAQKNKFDEVAFLPADKHKKPFYKLIDCAKPGTPKVPKFTTL